MKYTNQNDKSIEKRLHKDVDIDYQLPRTTILLRNPHGSKVYVIGTAHFSKESIEDVSFVIRNVRPDFVVVELCLSRLPIMMLNEKRMLEESANISKEKIKKVIQKNGIAKGAVYLTMLYTVAQITRELRVAPGGEFRRAYQEAKKIENCVTVLGDRPIEITFKRALASLSWWKCFKLTLLSLLPGSKDPISMEHIEELKRKNIYNEDFAKFQNEYSGFTKALIQERDMFLTYSLQQFAARKTPSKVVGVVGVAHLPGIQKYWGTVTDKQIAEVLTVPPRSKVTLFFKGAVKALIVGAIIYKCYQYYEEQKNKSDK